MTFDPNQLLNNPGALLNLKGQIPVHPPGENVAPEPTPAPAYDPSLYENAFGRLGLLHIANVADLGCGMGNFTGIMVKRRQRPEVYIGVDISHNNIKVAKAAYPGWNFIYGDFASPQVIQQYERFEAYLLLNVLDVLEDDLGFLETVPGEKPVLFSMPRFPKEGSVRHFSDVQDLRTRYSNHLSIQSVGRFADAQGEAYSMVVAKRW
ncbi:MAG: class I SAM-dependent methyltransferase [Deltaproteobacteria bacterium]|jgi:SAM-dependent methyltransferase|nr:class I SAM-dependent methyltransferase [Deltaproteobacteria bacterium]